VRVDDLFLLLASFTIVLLVAMNIATSYRTLLDALDAAPSDRLFVLEWHDVGDCHSVTFGDFRRRASQHACFLKQQGVRCGDRVVFVMPQGIALMAAFVGSMSLGALPAILAYPNKKVDSAKYSSGLGGVTATLKAPHVVVDANFPKDLIGDVSTSGATKLIHSPDSIESLGELDPVHLSLHPQGLAFIQHSAGTTGLQKGVALSHSAVLRQLSHLVEVLNVSAVDRLYSWLPLYHDMGLIACFMLPMVCHLSVIMQPPAEWVLRPETMLKLIHDHKCTLAWLPNFTFQFVPRRASAVSRSPYDMSSLRALINCSEPVKTESMSEFYEAFANQGLKREALQSSYAMAENVFAVTQSEPEGPLQIYADGQRFRSEHLIDEVPSNTEGAISFTSSGRLLPQNQARIVSETGETLPALHVGEILIKSDSLFDGYFNRPDLTAQVMIDGWYRTGDFGFFHGAELFVVGRKKDLLIIGGENIYPQDVEEIVCSHPAVHDGRAVALGLFNPGLGTEELVVVAEVEQQEVLEKSAQIERELRAKVFVEMGVSVRFLFLKPPRWIVKSTAGKLARSTTREKLLREYPGLGGQRMEDL
jgi:acyl-CoA synthetase (AMP-forming)/AMP-acid ligase II